MRPMLLLTIIFCLYYHPTQGQNIDTKHLKLQLQFDWEKRQAFGNAEITAAVVYAAEKIYLDAGKLVIREITLSGKKLKFNHQDGDSDNNLEILLDREYSPHEDFKLVITYHTTHENRADPLAIGGSFGHGLRFLNATASTPNKRKQVWSSGEPQNNRYWFPCNEDIADIHTTEMLATVEKPLIAIGNGRLVAVTENNANSRTFHYKANEPFPNYLVALVVGEYADWVQTTNGTSLHTFGYPHEMEAVEATVQQLPDMLQFLEEKTCFPYPYETYKQVVVQDYPFPGRVGQHSVTLLSDNYIDDEGVHHDFKYLWDGVALQAMANQWFGNLIMPASWGDLWLNNGFAQYFAGLYTEKDNGKEEYLTYYFPFEKSNVMGDWEAGNRHPIVHSDVMDLTAFANDSYSKFRAALVLRMLKKEMGEDLWWAAICDYVNTHAHHQVTTKDFQVSVEKVTGKSFQWFFEQWIYKMGLPSLEVSKHFDEKQKQLVVDVTQIKRQEAQTKHAQVTYFEGTIDIEIDGQVYEVYLLPQRENRFIFGLTVPPKFVNFNVEETFLGEVKYAQSPEECFFQLQYSTDVLAKQKAIDQLVTMANDTSASAAFRDQIWQSFTREVHSHHYWRYRWYALGSLRKIFIPPYDEKMTSFLQTLIQREKSWIKSTAIQMLGSSQDPRYKDVYITAMQDVSDRVINAAANALGKTKCEEAYDELMKLESQPSWKNQNRISALNGLQQLGDPRAVDFMMSCIKDNKAPRWYLATPVWDYPFAAVNALVALGKADLAYPILWERLQGALNDRDINDVFQQLQLINLLKDERAVEVYGLLKEKYKEDAFILEAVNQYEGIYLEGIKK